MRPSSVCTSRRTIPATGVSSECSKAAIKQLQWVMRQLHCKASLFAHQLVSMMSCVVRHYLAVQLPRADHCCMKPAAVWKAICAQQMMVATADALHIVPRLSKELMATAGQALKVNMTTLGPKVLPISEQLLFAANLVAAKLLGKKKVKPYVPDFGLAFKHICIHTGESGNLAHINTLHNMDVDATKLPVAHDIIPSGCRACGQLVCSDMMTQ